MSSLPPGMLMIVGGLLVALLPARWRAVAGLVIPLLSGIHMLWAVPNGTVTEWTLIGVELTPIRADQLSAIWGAVFHAAALLGALYSLHQRNRLERSMALIYAGSSIAAVFAGDLLSLFFFWEITSVSSALIVWAGQSSHAYRAGLRYLLMQVASGLLLLAGAVFCWTERGTLSFGGVGQMGVLGEPQTDLVACLVLLGFGIKAAFPLLHAWVPDAYPQASPGGTFFLSVFTTKLAVYGLVRGFAGCDLLVPVGCIMALAPLVYALLVDDVRRALAYCLINQLGLMVVAAGVGSELAINGVAAHAVAHVLYKGLLFMATGAVLLSTGTARASQLGGFGRSLPWVMVCYLIGAASISLPLFVGSVTKSLSLAAVAQAHHELAWLLLWAATAGVMFVCGLRIPADVFLGQPRSVAEPAQPVPWNMYAAMFVLASISLVIGLFPQLLYRRLPFAVDYDPYTLPHVIEQLQVIAFAGLAYILLVRLRLAPFWVRGHVWDIDWTYRVALPMLVAIANRGSQAVLASLREPIFRAAGTACQWIGQQLADDGRRGHFAPTGRMAMAATILLILYLLLYYR